MHTCFLVSLKTVAAEQIRGMFENIIQTSIFVRILIFAFITVLSINIIAMLVNLGLNIAMKVKGWR